MGNKAMEAAMERRAAAMRDKMGLMGPVESTIDGAKHEAWLASEAYQQWLVSRDADKILGKSPVGRVIASPEARLDFARRRAAALGDNADLGKNTRAVLEQERKRLAEDHKGRS